MARLKSKSFLSRLVLTLAVVLCPSIGQAQDHSFRIRNLPSVQAYGRLLNAKIFNLGGVGFAAMTTPEEKAFHVILNSPTAIEQFQRLLKEGNPEGQLYALYGLYLKDAQLFKTAAAGLKLDGYLPAPSEKFTEKRKIRFAKGCIFYDADRNKIIERMATGEFDEAFRARSLQASPLSQPLNY